MQYVALFEVWANGQRRLMTNNLQESLYWFYDLSETNNEVFVIDNSHPSPGKIINCQKSI